MHARMLLSIGLSTLTLAAGSGLTLAAGSAFAVAAGLGSVEQSNPPQGKPSSEKTSGDKASAGKAAKKGPLRAAGGYGIDSTHSTVLFRVKHLNTSWSFGRFDNVTGTFSIFPDDLEHSVLNVSIDIASIDTNEKKRDAVLKGEGFFDAEQFPDATFISHSIRKSGDTKYTAEGSFSLHGVKKPLTLELEETGTIDSNKTGFRAGFYGQFTIKRSDFGMTNMMDVLGDEVQVTVSIEATQTDALPKPSETPPK